MQKKIRRQGFTIVELVIVIAVIAILASVLVPVFGDVISNAQDSAAKQEAKNAFTAYIIDHPEHSSGLFIFVDDGRFVAIRNGVPVDVFDTQDAALATLTQTPDDSKLTQIPGTDLWIYDVAVTPDAPTDPITPTDWTGATAVFVGDSITYGSSTTKIYHTYLQEMLGLGTVTNLGIAGSCYSVASDYGVTNNPLSKRYTEIPDAELIVIFMGTNDFGHQTPLGNPSDATDVSFYGALNEILPAVKAAHPSSQLVVMTPLHRYHQTTNNGGMNFPEDDKPNNAGHTLAEYVNAIKTVCASNDIPVIDLFNLFPLDPTQEAVRSTYMPDGLHPNAAGHEILAQTISAELVKIPRKEGYTPQPPEIDPGYTLRNGNRFGDANTDKLMNRACNLENIQLTAGTVVILKDNSTYNFALANTQSQTDSNKAGSIYFPENKYTEQGYCIIQTDGWYGFTLVKQDQSDFDFTQESTDLLDYFIILDTMTMQAGNRFAGATVDRSRLSSTHNLYLREGTVVTFLPGTEAKQWAISKVDGPTGGGTSYQHSGGWTTDRTFTVETSGYYGFVLNTGADTSVQFDAADGYSLFDFFQIVGPVHLQYGNRFGNDTRQSRLSSSYNLYLPAGTVITFKTGAGAAKWALSQTNGPTGGSANYVHGGWTTNGSYTVTSDGYYGFTVHTGSDTTNFQPYQLIDLLNFFDIQFP